jgi:hypothetical protein
MIRYRMEPFTNRGGQPDVKAFQDDEGEWVEYADLQGFGILEALVDLEEALKVRGIALTLRLEVIEP